MYLVSNDADFAGVMQYVRTIRAFVLSWSIQMPGTRALKDLSNAATCVKRLWKSYLRRSQLPDTLTDKIGIINKPANG